MYLLRKEFTPNSMEYWCVFCKQPLRGIEGDWNNAMSWRRHDLNLSSIIPNHWKILSRMWKHKIMSPAYIFIEHAHPMRNIFSTIIATCSVVNCHGYLLSCPYEWACFIWKDVCFESCLMSTSIRSVTITITLWINWCQSIDHITLYLSQYLWSNM